MNALTFNTASDQLVTHGLAERRNSIGGVKQGRFPLAPLIDRCTSPNKLSSLRLCSKIPKPANLIDEWTSQSLRYPQTSLAAGKGRMGMNYVERVFLRRPFNKRLPFVDRDLQLGARAQLPRTRRSRSHCEPCTASRRNRRCSVSR